VEVQVEVRVAQTRKKTTDNLGEVIGGTRSMAGVDWHIWPARVERETAAVV